MKKIKRITLYLIVALVLLPYTTVLMIHNITLINTIIGIDAGYFGKSSYTLALPKEIISGNELKNILLINPSKKYAIYADYTSLENVKGIYFEKEFVNMPMLEGRFFVPEDFSKDNYCAVVGKKHKKDIIYKNNDRYIYVNGTKFKVLGIIGLDDKSSIDNIIYINALNKLSSAEKFKIFTLDYFGDDGETFISNVINLLNNKLKTEVDIISTTQSTMSRLIPNILSGSCFIAIIFCDILCISLLSIEWKNQYIYEYSIKRLIGFNNRKIFKDILKKYGLICIICAFISSIIINIWFIQYIKYIGIGFILTSIYILLFSIIITKSIIKEPLAEAIK